MERIEIDIPKKFSGKLIKDLQEDEGICTYCDGTGLRIEDNVYGLEGERSRVMFPYKHQSITFCNHCYNGVVHICHYCGKDLGQGYRCDCEGYKNAELEKEQTKKKETFEKAKKITYEEYIKQFPNYMIYDVQSEEFFNDLDDLIELYEYREYKEYPKYVYATDRITIKLDLDNILEDACEELHEDAIDCIDGVEDFQEAIDKFNELNKENGATFYPNCSIAVLIDIKKEYN